MNDVTADSGITTATERTLKIKKKFLRMPVRWDDRSQMWFKTFCRKFKAVVSAKDKVIQCISMIKGRLVLKYIQL